MIEIWTRGLDLNKKKKNNSFAVNDHSDNVRNFKIHIPLIIYIDLSQVSTVTSVHDAWYRFVLINGHPLTWHFRTFQVKVCTEAINLPLWSPIRWVIDTLGAVSIFCFIVQSHKISILWDWVLKYSYRFEIWQAHRQHCCRGACHVETRLKNLNTDLDLRDSVRSYDKILRQAHGAFYLTSVSYRYVFRDILLSFMLDKREPQCMLLF